MPNNNPFQVPLQKLELAIQRVKPQLIDAMGVEALKFIDDNFAKQGFQGETFEPWPKLKKQPKGAKRKILVDTATLRRSPKQTNSTDHTTISTDVPYAQVHNEGGDINHASRGAILNYTRKGGKLRLGKVQTESQQRKIKEIRRATIGAHITKMPKRQFMGPSPVLNRACERAIIDILKPVLNTI
jgi:phage gpG-like protein